MSYSSDDSKSLDEYAPRKFCKFSIEPKLYLMLKYILSVCFVWSSLSCFSQSDSITIATWNLEHLGSDGRGFPEHVSEGFTFRTPSDLRKIARLLDNELEFDIVCLQEISVSRKQFGKAFSDQLDILVEKLGSNWAYYLSYTGPCDTDQDKMQNAFLYNTSRVTLKEAFELDVPFYKVGGKQLYDRIPLIGHFSMKENPQENQFVLVNLHLASGQNNDENHLAAMVMVEQNLREALKNRDILEPNRTSRYALEDVVFLGDFNDNPYALKPNGACCKNLDFLYQYMARKYYSNLVTVEMETTRMNKNYNSTIDHILIHRSLKKYVNVSKAYVYYPHDSSETEKLTKWRKVYSDHFPVYFKLGKR